MRRRHSRRGLSRDRVRAGSAGVRDEVVATDRGFTGPGPPTGLIDLAVVRQCSVRRSARLGALRWSESARGARPWSLARQRRARCARWRAVAHIVRHPLGGEFNPSASLWGSSGGTSNPARSRVRRSDPRPRRKRQRRRLVGWCYRHLGDARGVPGLASGVRHDGGTVVTGYSQHFVCA